jgi:peroxiredoxin-like protein
MIEADDHGTEVVRGEWRGGFAGAGTVGAGGVACPVAAPAAIGGSGTGANPSSLLVSAAAGCYLLTLAAILEQRGLDVVRIALESEGRYRGSAPPQLVEIVHRPDVVVRRAADARLGAVRRCFELARTSCTATRTMPGVSFVVEGTSRQEHEPSQATT